MHLDDYMRELTDSNWHTLRELIEYQQGTLDTETDQEVSNALECAIAYLEWTRYYKSKTTLIEHIDRRLEWAN